MQDIRRKGKEAEQEACRLLRRWFPDVLTKRAGGETTPHDRGRDLLNTPGWCFQIKARTVLHAEKWLAEAERAVRTDERPLVLWKQPRRGWFVIRRYGPTWAMSAWSPELGEHLFRNGVCPGGSADRV